MGLPYTSAIHSKGECGKRNLITDVPGVKVGHVTIQDGEVNTGVTAILPHGGNLFKEKVMAGVSVINGFGKSVGLIQIEELGTIESPIILTNTLSAGTALTAMAKYLMEQNRDIGICTSTVNCVITECNDGRLNDIRGLHVREEDVLTAVKGATEDFSEGAIGAGTGMVCLGLKGGIGSASRVVKVDEKSYTIGALVMSNFGEAGNLIIGGRHIDTRVCENHEKKDVGSIIIVIATDVPLNERQLKRVAKRSMIVLGRVGSYCGNGSGDIAIAFTTANNLPHYSEKNILPTRMFYDENIDCIFEASVEAVEEAIISSLYHAKTTTGVRGNTYMGLQDFMAEYGDKL
jgi:D-aminopeptidase